MSDATASDGGWGEQARRNDLGPRRHLGAFRWYETHRKDFRYLVEDIWDGYPVDAAMTDSILAVLRMTMGAIEQGYAVRITASDGSAVEHHPRDDGGGYLGHPWYPSEPDGLAGLGLTPDTPDRT